MLVPDAGNPGSLPDAAIQLFPGLPHVGGAKGNVLVHGLFKKLVLRILENQPYPEPHIPDFLRLRPDVLPLQQHTPGGGLQQAVEMLDKGGFPGSGVADDPQELSRADGKTHVLYGAALEGRTGAIGMGKVLNL
jgi:hypothetical protein